MNQLCWPLSQLGDAFSALLQHSSAEVIGAPSSAQDAGGWLERAALRHGCELEAVEFCLRDLEQELPLCYPAIVQVSEDCYLAVVKGGRRRLRVIAPDLSVRSVSTKQVCRSIRGPLDCNRREELLRFLRDAGVSPSCYQRALNALMAEHTGAKCIQNCWVIKQRSMPSAACMIAAHTAQYLLWLASWAVLGTLSFSGRLDRGWLLAWALLLLTLIPFRLLATWLQGVFAIRLGGLLKRKLLTGALLLEPEEVRSKGIGNFLGQALEAESVEVLAVSGGVAGVLASIELVPALWVLGKLAWALAAFCVLAAVAGWRFLRSFQRWNSQRMELTTQTVESMVGHRTRLAQQPREDWHTAEDQELAHYLSASREIDVNGSWLIAAVPRAWLLVGLAAMAPSVVAGGLLNSQAAILLGGVLLAYSAFQRLVASFTDVAAAITAWRRIAPLLQASERREEGAMTARTSTLRIDADRLTFRYPGQAGAALESCSFSIRRGERILLEGPSGGGKTTLASLLAGLRKPNSGLLLVNGLDRHTLGEQGWRSHVAAAPQFHENHLITETLAFNLLMSRRGPITPTDLTEAEELCRELGLGDLLDRMPSGVLQMVGEGGWQLSHGERSRVFLARALLQNSGMVILDESFAALDPESLRTALKCTLRRAETLLVIAHPC